MNPPFSASPGVQRIRHEADLRHLRSAFSMLPAGGRLVAITSAGCIPGDAAWSRAFERLDPPPRPVFSIAIDGRAYARRGTTFDTRLTVIDRDPANAQERSDRRTGNRPHGRRVACSHCRQCAADGKRSYQLLRRHCRPAICSAMPPHGRPHESAPAATASGVNSRPAAPHVSRLGPGGRTRLRDLTSADPARQGKRTGGHPCRRLRALASPNRAHSRRLRTSDAAGAIRRHGGRAPSCAGVPPDASRAYRDGRTAVRRATGKRHPRRSGPRPPSYRRSTASARVGRPWCVLPTMKMTTAMTAIASRRSPITQITAKP